MFEFFDTIYQFITNDIFIILNDFVVFLAAKATIAFFTAKIFMVSMAWQVGSQVLTELNITTAINQAWGNLDSDTYNAIAFFRVPDALNIIMASYPAKMFMRMLGF